ncbi:N-formylglutamate amidohydrolase [Sphingomonas turrisvirgatae]|uniref:N-formylglutamate amidohydrolase n=1 Tax=Sphingomonas turrisvirgatae TaxID=1888892 RepID=A0A1E3LZY4_9SPHN|nr:N-formylglutamate amidohydrolase [Sphingomonas turrisvirgatae]ODP39304.1 N-formylglutamate amidohydrolase [Sphingomonas turrisvirgatae]
MTMPHRIDGAADLLILCDHASNGVPAGIDLGIDPMLLNKHIAIDIGAGAVSEAMATLLDAPAILATVSRLVIDLNREPDSAGLIPLVSDGHAIPGNQAADRTDRIARFHAPYHAAIASAIRACRPRLLVSVHSFTQRLERHDGPDRPWEIGILYNRDARAARRAIAAFTAAGVVTGDNEPYSGRILNATMNRHAEANGIPYIGIEIRNDLIGNPAGVAHWAEICSQIVSSVRDHLAEGAGREP